MTWEKIFKTEENGKNIRWEYRRLKEDRNKYVGDIDSYSRRKGDRITHFILFFSYFPPSSSIPSYTLSPHLVFITDPLSPPAECGAGEEHLFLPFVGSDNNLICLYRYVISQGPLTRSTVGSADLIFSVLVSYLFSFYLSTYLFIYVFARIYLCVDLFACRRWISVTERGRALWVVGIWLGRNRKTQEGRRYELSSRACKPPSLPDP